MRPISYTRATDVASAITTVSADPQRAFLAGGTTEIDLLRLNVVQPSGLVDINLLPLKQIEELADGGLRFGHIPHPCERSAAQATMGKLFDLLERQQIDVNETAGLYDIQAQ